MIALSAERKCVQHSIYEKQAIKCIFGMHNAHVYEKLYLTPTHRSQMQNMECRQCIVIHIVQMHKCISNSNYVHVFYIWNKFCIQVEHFYEL